MTDQPHMRIEVISQPRYLATARAMITALSQRYGFSDDESSQIALALDEAICNVINHGYQKCCDGRIWISIWPLSEPSPGLRILIEDTGQQVDPKTIQSRDLDKIRPGGLGVYIIRQIMDKVEYQKRANGGMQLLLEKYLHTDDNDNKNELATDTDCTDSCNQQE